ncbi:hypothetical protein [Herbaspirillum rubrisubalbicans]|uniref:hypothetical protein n=1 Tax=Herbaspirillum rubrisubalbicans TaxID=80842 RepID=UPI0015C54A80|nr:hypothetical protein [Herbaspirillum rubrisubalbicans]
MRDDLISDQITIMKFWRAYMFVMFGLHYFLGIASVVLAVTIASKPFKVSPGDNTYEVLAWLLALSTGLVGFISPERVGERYQKAFQVLSMAITRFRGDSSYTVNHVLDAYQTGEQFIHEKRTTE